MEYKSSIDFARNLDEEDPLKGFRAQFHIPKTAAGNDCIYLCGNSLGLQPQHTTEYVGRELEDWAALGVEGHTQARNPWLPYHEILTEKMARVVGALPHEVVMMNTLSVNLHLMMVSFYRPTVNRYKILIEADAFPSDRYAVESQLRFHGYEPAEALIELRGTDSNPCITKSQLEDVISENGDQIALILIGNVNYYTGQFFNMEEIARMGHESGAYVGFDCAHGAGNLPLNLHDSGADFAVWCSYKYLNSGPGSVAGCFVHERHSENDELNRFAGWWGHDKESRFKMPPNFKPIPGAEGWQLSNPPILSLAAILSSLDLFDEAGIDRLRDKSIKLTGFLEFLVNQIPGNKIRIITPSVPDERGCQLSIQVWDSDRKLFDRLSEAGVIADWREPDVIRLAPVPLYNSFEDVYRTYEILKNVVL